MGPPSHWKPLSPKQLLSSPLPVCPHPGPASTLALSPTRGTQLDWRGTWVAGGLEPLPHGEHLQKPEGCSLQLVKGHFMGAQSLKQWREAIGKWICELVVWSSL